MIKQASLHADLESIVGADGVAAGGSRFEVDGIAPLAVVRPAKHEDLPAVMRFANDTRLSVIPLGGRTNCGLGNLPTRYDIALDLTQLDRVVEFEPADLTITCEAGISLGSLRRATAAAGLMVPFDPGLPDNATAGGVLAANVSGPARMSLGTSRDFTIGMRVITADGRLTRAGGKVVKNVAGYDLCKLYIGSLGSLGVITESTFKTVPLPRAEDTIELRFDSINKACAVSRSAAQRGLVIRCLRLSPAGGGWLLDARLAGTPGAVSRSMDELRSLADEFGAATSQDLAPPWPDTEQLVLRFNVLPTHAPAVLTRCLAAWPSASIECLPTVAVCRIAVRQGSTDDVSQAFRIAEATGATVTIERAPVEVKQQIDVFREPHSSFALMREVKREFDPNSTLSPGRLVGRL